ncbi:MAG: acetate kinase [Nitrospiraceae bacterium]|nr:MAG: acetate kinase [Nitrospiraceae bacterium]
MKAILVINSGSSSIKYRFFQIDTYSVLASGFIDKIGESESRLRHAWQNEENKYEEIVETRHVPDHRNGFDWIVDVSTKTLPQGKKADLFAIGHRVVHGGEVFSEPTLIDDNVIAAIRQMIPLAPLHNPANLTGIEVARERRPDAPQVAVFDTAFHQTIPPAAFRYALPRNLYTGHHVRRYGFHGTSHHYVAKKAAEHLGRPLGTLNLITLHLGNGASATAIRDGKSIDTSMGMTPMEGLVMGTRCGDIDPAILFYLGRTTGRTFEELEMMLNHESGLKGICGVNDMREIIRRARSGDGNAQLAIEIYCYRVRKYVGAYFAVLGQVDALVFTGGIGENAALIRMLCCKALECLGIVIDSRKNEASSPGVSEIQGEKGAVRILVIPANEELEIARQTCDVILRGR